MSPKRPRRVLWGLALVALVVTGLPLGAAHASPGDRSGPRELRVTVTSSRADLVTGGDARVEVAGLHGRSALVVRAGGRDVTSAFDRRSAGRADGVVTGLARGRSSIVARQGRREAVLRITNHPIGGPLFAGAQVQPWVCRTQTSAPNPVTTPLGAPRDAQCNTPSVVNRFYRSTDPAKPGFLPYDADAPPSDVATTTTDAGRTVPFVVRQELGVQDRGVYAITLLDAPGAWNRKLVVPFGGGTATHHTQGPPSAVLSEPELARGYAVASNGLLTHGSNANDKVAAEAVSMLKERVVEAHGAIRYTIGRGCSGGAVLQHLVAAGYPGLLDGIIPNCTYPEDWTTLQEIQDCSALTRYFDGAGDTWSEEQRVAVDGHADRSACGQWVRYAGVFLPDVAANCDLPAEQVYDPVGRRDGVRCTQQDYGVAVWGRRGEDGFARRPADNVGVQYGRQALAAGTITPEQFVDLNARIGGFDVDGRPQAARTRADAAALPIAYRTAAVPDGRALADVPVLDLRGTANSDNIHTDYHSYALQQRLRRDVGTDASQAIWTFDAAGGPAGGIIPPPEVAAEALDTMDAWLAGIRADRSHRSDARKVLAHRPPAATDRCLVDGRWVTDRATCARRLPFAGDARIAAGAPLARDVLACRRTPLRAADYPVRFTPGQWSRLRAAFPTGVCDWSRRGVGTQRSVDWLTFAGGPGGRPLGPVPRSRAVR